MDSLKMTDAASAAIATAPRVSLQSIEDKIAAEYSFTADKALDGCPLHEALKIFTICIIVMKNGFMVTGESAPASPENFNAELGHKFAREHAIRKLWGFEGYALRERLAEQSATVRVGAA
jgi:hypothetical protein